MSGKKSGGTTHYPLLTLPRPPLTPPPHPTSAPHTPSRPDSPPTRLLYLPSPLRLTLPATIMASLPPRCPLQSLLTSPNPPLFFHLTRPARSSFCARLSPPHPSSTSSLPPAHFSSFPSLPLACCFLASSYPCPPLAPSPPPTPPPHPSPLPSSSTVQPSYFNLPLPISLRPPHGPPRTVLTRLLSRSILLSLPCTPLIPPPSHPLPPPPTFNLSVPVQTPTLP